jgi:hypothetical protein
VQTHLVAACIKDTSSAVTHVYIIPCCLYPHNLGTLCMS